MAGKEKPLIGQLDQLSIQPPTPPLTTSNETSPDSPTPFETLPLGIDIILAELYNRHKGRPQHESEWWCVHLSLDDFENLEARIQTDENLYGFVADKIKYDYFPHFSQFVLRMGDDLHEFILAQLETNITEQLFLIKQGDNQQAVDFARKVVATRSPKIVLDALQRHAPDGSFGHENAEDPGVIIEVSHSQKRKDLPFLADDYILGSNGTIQVVIGIDVEYQKKKGAEAKVFVWRPRFVQQDGAIALEASQTFEGVFRAHDGSLVNENQVLCIQLKDFGNKSVCPEIDDILGDITITFSQLYDIVQRGDKRKQTVSQRRQRSEVNPPDMPKRRRLRSPPEELCDQDEERFQEQEEEVERRLSEQDSDYAPR